MTPASPGRWRWRARGSARGPDLPRPRSGPSRGATVRPIDGTGSSHQLPQRSWRCPRGAESQRRAAVELLGYAVFSCRSISGAFLAVHTALHQHCPCRCLRRAVLPEARASRASPIRAASTCSTLRRTPQSSLKCAKVRHSRQNSRVISSCSALLSAVGRPAFLCRPLRSFGTASISAEVSADTPVRRRNCLRFSVQVRRSRSTLPAESASFARDLWEAPCFDLHGQQRLGSTAEGLGEIRMAPVENQF
jgi:hypothetical protein